MRNLRKILVLLLFCTYFIAVIRGQDKNRIEYQVMNKDSIPSFIKFKETPNNFSKGQEKDVFKEYLKLTLNDDLKKVHTKSDDLGFTHEKYQQFYKGISVEFAVYNVHLKNDQIISINGNFKKVEKLDINPEITEETALQKALEHIDADEYLWQVPEMEQWIKQERNDPNATFYPRAELLIVKNVLGSGKISLAFKFDINSSKPSNQYYIYVDAKSGIIINSISQLINYDEIKNADTRYSGSRHIDTYFVNGGYVLRDYTRGNGIEVRNLNNSSTTYLGSAVDFVDTNNVWSDSEWNNAEKDNAALDALWASQKTFDYFMTIHNSDLSNILSTKMKCYVHWDVNKDEAKWNPSFNSLTLGDGNVKYNPLTSIDVIAHEFGHGLCIKTSGLYAGDCAESAALHEGFSDIWGACVKYFAEPEKNEWLSGDEIRKDSTYTRSLSDPNSKGHPDTYLGNFWYAGTNVGDYMHINCGVLNYWFYLLSIGGSGINDRGDYYQVEGIGIENAAKIAFRMETADYLTYESDFTDARFYALLSAGDLYGLNSTQVIQTAKAWHAVGVGDPNVIPFIPDSQIRGGYDNVTYNSVNTFYITPAQSNEGTLTYYWTIIPYSMNCSSDKLPYFLGTNTGTSVYVKHGSCTGKYILRCEARTGWSRSYYQDRVINVYNPSGGGGDDPDPCATVMTIYPNPSKKNQYTVLKIQYPIDPCDDEMDSYMTLSTNNELNIYDLSGNLVFQEKFDTDTYSFANTNLKKNNYIIIVKDKYGRLHQKQLTIK